jgi:hypothetical protein
MRIAMNQSSGRSRRRAQKLRLVCSQEHERTYVLAWLLETGRTPPRRHRNGIDRFPSALSESHGLPRLAEVIEGETAVRGLSEVRRS